jgi:hypothetical protein
MAFVIWGHPVLKATEIPALQLLTLVAANLTMRNHPTFLHRTG